MIPLIIMFGFLVVGLIGCFIFNEVKFQQMKNREKKQRIKDEQKYYSRG